MAVLASLPDFGRISPAGEGIVAAPFASGAWGAVPTAMRLACDAAGAPRLLLELVKRSDDLSAAGRSAVLDLQLTGEYALDEALGAARTADPAATVRALPIELGFARLVPAGSALGLDAAAASPVPLGWSAADGARWTQRLSPAAGGLIRDLLRAGQFPFGARLEFTIRGVAPRRNAKIRFDPVALLGAAAGKQTTMALDALHAFLASGGAATLIALEGDLSRGELPDLLLDRLATAYGTLAPAERADGPLTVALTPPPAGAVMWDLAEPIAVSRAFLLRFDPAAAIGSAALAACVRETVVPSLDLGFREILVTANLPEHLGAPAVGVIVDMPPHPPHRPSAINETLTLAAPDYSETIRLRLAPEEPLDYTLTTFALLVDQHGASERRGAPIHRQDDWLQLQASDFPFQLAHLTLEERLAALADLTVTVSATAAGAISTSTRTLGDALPDYAFTIAAGADAELGLIVRAKDGSASIDLGVSPFEPRALDLADVPGYGPHRVALHADLAPDDTPIALDLVGQDGANPASLTLAPGFADDAWGYVASNPFHAGFRWRANGGSWVDASGTELRIAREDAVKPKTDGHAEDHTLPPEIDGVRLFAAAGQPDTIRYLPAAPIATDAGGGRPAVSLVRTEQAVTIQVGAQFALSGTEQDKLATALSVPNFALQPVPVQVDHVALLLTGPDGREREIAGSGSSGYPPFNAALSATLSADDGARAIGAVGGLAGILTVSYAVRAPDLGPDPIVSRADVAGWIPPGTAKDHIVIV